MLDMLRYPAVGLTEVERSYDQIVANRRMTDVRQHGRRNRAYLADVDDEFDNHLVGVHGEHAFAKWLGEAPKVRNIPVCASCGLYAGTVNTFKEGGDVGRYQVRTRRRLDAPLIVRADDRDSDIFVLVAADLRHRDPQFFITGWEYARVCKRSEFARDPGARGTAYFVPQRELMPISSLPR